MMYYSQWGCLEEIREGLDFILAQIIWSWQCCQLLVGNIANGIAKKNFILELHNWARNTRNFLEAMPLAMLPTKSLQHCHDQMIRANMHINFFLLFLTDFFWPLVVIRVVTLRIRHLSSFSTYGQFHREIMSKRFQSFNLCQLFVYIWKRFGNYFIMI